MGETENCFWTRNVRWLICRLFDPVSKLRSSCSQSGAAVGDDVLDSIGWDDSWSKGVVADPLRTALCFRAALVGTRLANYQNAAPCQPISARLVFLISLSTTATAGNNLFGVMLLTECGGWTARDNSSSEAAALRCPAASRAPAGSDVEAVAQQCVLAQSRQQTQVWRQLHHIPSPT